MPDLKKMSVVAVKVGVVSQFVVPPQLLVFAPPSHVRFWLLAVNGEASRANARAAERARGIESRNRKCEHMPAGAGWAVCRKQPEVRQERELSRQTGDRKRDRRIFLAEARKERWNEPQSVV